MGWLKYLLPGFLLAIAAAQGAYFSKQVKELDTNCPTWHIERFKEVQRFFTIGVTGATRFGFDLEVPITRRGVDILHCATDYGTYLNSSFCQNHVSFGQARPFQGYQNFPAEIALKGIYSNLEEQLTAYYSYVFNWLNLEEPSYFNVGHMLEYLSRFYLHDMAAIFPPEEYSITGGVLYYNFKGGKQRGELDIVVYRQDTCQVVAIGESKASSKSSMSSALSKARKQLRRIANFINNHSL